MKLSRLDLRWETRHPFMVVDASMREHIPQHWQGQVIAPAFLGQDTGRCPVLIDVRALVAAELASLQEQLDEQTAQRDETFASVLLAARPSATLASLSNHLGKRLAINMPGEDHPKQFRFFDPGTLLQLPRILGNQGTQWLLGPITSALIPWAGHWTVMTSPTNNTSLTSHGYSRQQLEELLHLGAVNRAAAQLPPPADAHVWQEQTAQLARHVMRASHHELTNLHDLAAFALHAMQWHPRFDSHPRIQELLRELKSSAPDDELDYRELSGRIAPEQWQTLAAELGAPPKNQVSTPP